MSSSSRKPSETMIRAIHGACLREDRLVVGVRRATTEALVSRGLARYWTGGVRITEDAYREHTDEAHAMQRANEKTAAREAREAQQEQDTEPQPVEDVATLYAPGMLREGVLRVVTAVQGSEEQAAAEAERLVPRGDHVVMRVVQGIEDRAAIEERRYVVGVVASLMRAGARHSVADGALVLRWEGVTTLVRLAA